MKKPVKKRIPRKPSAKAPVKKKAPRAEDPVKLQTPKVPARTAEAALAEAEAAQQVADQKNKEAFAQGYQELCDKTGVQLVAQVTFVGQQSNLTLVAVNARQG